MFRKFRAGSGFVSAETVGTSLYSFRPGYDFKDALSRILTDPDAPQYLM